VEHLQSSGLRLVFSSVLNYQPLINNFMPILDPVNNFAKASLTAGIDASATSFSVSAGEGARFPNPATSGAYNVTIWNFTDYGDPSDDPNREIIRVTARSTDTFTVTRAQEGTSAVTHNTALKTYKIVLSVTKKTIDDLMASVVGDGVQNSTSGRTTRAGDTASGSQTIAHGLGEVPNKIRISAIKIVDPALFGNQAISNGAYENGGSNCIYSIMDGGAGADGIGNNSANMIEIWDDQTGSDKQVATITVDATNIILAWTKSGSPTSDAIQILWEAIGTSTVEITGGGTKLALDTTQQVVPQSTTQTLYTVPIPGNTLGTNNGIKFRIPISSLANDGGNSTTVNVKYGGTTIGSFAYNVNASNSTGYIEGIIMANNSASAQKSQVVMVIERDVTATGDARVHSDFGSATEDSSVQQDLEIEIVTGVNCGMTAEAIIVEQITPRTQGSIISKSGTATGSSAIQNSVQSHVITHSLGIIPRVIRLSVKNISSIGGGGVSASIGSANTDGASTIESQQCILVSPDSTLVPFDVHSVIGNAGGNGATVDCELTDFDADTFTLEWSATASVNGTPEYTWEVIA
jgi:hypothetical protein